MLKFISLTIEDFGPFKGVQTIDFTDKNGVTLIWGNNGRGKTTLLNIFRYAIYGKFQNRRGALVDLTALTNRESRIEGRYGFKVILNLEYCGESYKLTRQYKLRNGISRPTKNDDYEQVVSLKKGATVLSNVDAEHMLRLMMPSEVSRFFLFDGELLQEYEELLQEDSTTGATIKESIEKILGMPVLTNGAADTGKVLDFYENEKTRMAQKNKKTEQLGAQIVALKVKRQEHTADLERHRKELIEQQAKKAELKGQLDENEHVQKLLRDMDNLDSSITTKKFKKEALLSEMCSATKDAWKGLVGERVSQVLATVNTKLKDLESKETEHRVSTQIINSMKASLEKKHCELCDRDIEDAEKLKKRISEVETGLSKLSDEETEMLKELQQRQAVLESFQFSSNKQTIEVLERQLAIISVEITDEERKLKEVKEELQRHGDVETLSTKMQQCVEELSQCLKKIDILKDSEKTQTDAINDIKGILTGLNAKLDRAATGTDMVLARKRVEICEQIHNIFEEGIDAYRQLLKTSVEKDATNLFVQITNDPDYVGLQITDTYGMNIIHKDGGEPVPLRSAGFEHIVALSLIGALHKNAPLSGPIIMDSPLGRLDPIHKANITRLLPQLADQVVLLAYTHEIDEQLARSSLGTALKKEYRLAKETSFYTRIEEERNDG